MIMTKLRFSITVTFLIAALSALGFGQLWSNVLSSSRATDWTGVGISGRRSLRFLGAMRDKRLQHCDRSRNLGHNGADHHSSSVCPE